MILKRFHFRFLFVSDWMSPFDRVVCGEYRIRLLYLFVYLNLRVLAIIVYNIVVVLNLRVDKTIL